MERTEFRFHNRPDPVPEQMSYWQRIGIAVEFVLAPVGGVCGWFAFLRLMELVR